MNAKPSFKNRNAVYHIIIAPHLPHAEGDMLDVLDSIAKTIHSWKTEIEDARVAEYELRNSKPTQKPVVVKVRKVLRIRHSSST